MTNNDSKTVIYVRTDKDVVDKFDKLYPHVRSRFITGALEYACNNQEFCINMLFGKKNG